jgi:23S rRNA (uridine2552-2'-O)-methyltransferase
MSRNNYHKPDVYTQKAKKEGYFARSIYKLEEIDQKYQIIKSGMKILDLGAAPGSWSQYCVKKCGSKGIVVGIDIKNITAKIGDNYVFFHKSILDEDIATSFQKYAPFDVFLSDMAPSTSGIKDKDVFESIELSRIAIQQAKIYMKKNGTFICKVFQGEDFDDFYRELKSVFSKHKSFKPAAVRSNSKEIYVIAWGLK